MFSQEPHTQKTLTMKTKKNAQNGENPEWDAAKQ